MSYRDQLFTRFMAGMFVLLCLYGSGMGIALIIGVVSENIARSLISGFVAMFSGVLGLGSGYLLGANGSLRNGNGEKKDEK